MTLNEKNQSETSMVIMNEKNQSIKNNFDALVKERDYYKKHMELSEN